MLKKILIIFILLFPKILFAGELDIKANIPSGEFEYAIEINLIPNKEGKIFYYTDGVGMVKDQKEYSGPITIKKDKTLSFWLMGENYDSSLIKEEDYTFNYPKKIELNYKNGNIKIINKKDNVINLGYWILETKDLNYKINKNTFIQPGGNIEIPYEKDGDFIIKLISPDNKVLISKDIKEIEINNTTNILPSKKEIQTNIKEKNKENYKKEEKNIKKKDEEKIIEKEKKEDEESNFSFASSLKTSILNSSPNEKKENKEINNDKKEYIDKENDDKYMKIILILFVIITLGITAYNIYFVLKNSKKIKK